LCPGTRGTGRPGTSAAGIRTAPSTWSARPPRPEPSTSATSGRSGSRGVTAAAAAVSRSGNSKVTLTIAASGAVVGVLQADDVALVEEPEGDLEHPAAGSGGGEAVRGAAHDDDLVADGGLEDVVVDLDAEARVQDDPELVALLVLLEAERLAGVDRQDLDRRLLVMGELPEVPPWTVVLDDRAQDLRSAEDWHRSGSFHVRGSAQELDAGFSASSTSMIGMSSRTG